MNEIVRLSKEKQIPVEVYEGCNHSLECEDTLTNIEFLADIMRKTKDFISGILMIIDGIFFVYMFIVWREEKLK